MKKLKKTLCEYSRKDIEKNRDLFAAAVREPRYLCNKCARASNDKKLLCKPDPLPESQE
jgi:hypothetical protein